MNRFDWRQIVKKTIFAPFRSDGKAIKVTEDDNFTASICVGEWGSRIEVHGENAEDAEEFRDWVLKAIQNQIDKEERE